MSLPRLLGKMLVMLLALLVLCGFTLSRSFPKTDAVLSEQIQAKILQDPQLAALSINITVTNANVSVGGTVPAGKQANALIILIESVAGVQSVDIAGLSLANGGTLSEDDFINSEVIGTLNREGLMGPLSQMPRIIQQTGPGNRSYSISPPPIHIQVITKERVVYLSGTVPDQKTADKAVNLATSIPGVIGVQSSLKVGE